MKLDPARVLSWRARATHLDAKLVAGALADACRGGLQDSIPRAGVIGLHARVADVQPDSWDHPSLAQIWFRGADYIVPRSDLAPFTIGTLPRDDVKRRGILALADRVVAFLDGRELKVREITQALGLEHPMSMRMSSMSGRVLIRWNASNIWAYACGEQVMDVEEARLELVRRFLRWLGPQTTARFAKWAGVEPTDAKATWTALAPELVDVEVAGEQRSLLAADLDALRTAEPITGVRLIHNDDPWCKLDHDLLAADAGLHERIFPKVGTSRGYAPGAVVVDGTIVGVWQRRQRKVRIHPWKRRFSPAVRDTIEVEALSFPVAAKTNASVSFEPVGSG